jgi:hypothetical protein
VLPRIDEQTMIAGIEVDFLASFETGFQDYGIDMDWLAEEENGKIDYGIRFTDQNRPPTKKGERFKIEYEELIKKKKPKSRMEQIAREFIGTGGSGFIVKELVVNSGHGAHRAGLTFDRILRTSHYKDGNPLKVRRKLSKGPREAAKGFRIN